MATPRSSYISSSGLQDRAWESPPLTWVQRALWAWFVVYIIGLTLIARRLASHAHGWWRVAFFVAVMALGMLAWRRSLTARFKRVSTTFGYWALRFAYWVLFAPWAFLVQRKDPLQMRQASASSWRKRPPTLTTLSQAQRQY